MGIAIRILLDLARNGQRYSILGGQGYSNFPTPEARKRILSRRRSERLITAHHYVTCAFFSAHGPITCLVSKRRVLIRPHQRHPQRYRSRSGKPDLEPDYGMGRKSTFTPIGTRN